jgi:RNA polymerase sigma-70 factor, ECF subfamily
VTNVNSAGHPNQRVRLSIASLRPPLFAEDAQASSSSVSETKSAVDPLVFDAVYRDTAALVMRVLRRLVPEDLVEDAFQEVFIVVARKLDGFDQKAKASTWIYGIAVRVASDQRRAHKRRSRRERAFVDEPQVDSHHGPDHDLALKQARRLLHQLLEHMEDELREVFVLADIEEVPGPQIAEILGLPLNTVHSRLRRARASFESIRVRLTAT